MPRPIIPGGYSNPSAYERSCRQVGNFDVSRLPTTSSIQQTGPSLSETSLIHKNLSHPFIFPITSSDFETCSITWNDAEYKIGSFLSAFVRMGLVKVLEALREKKSYCSALAHHALQYLSQGSGGPQLYDARIDVYFLFARRSFVCRRRVGWSLVESWVRFFVHICASPY